MLANATQHTEKYYGSDVKVAYRLLEGLLQHESSQQGFNLTATQDVHFTEVTRTRKHDDNLTPPLCGGCCGELIRLVTRTGPAWGHVCSFLPPPPSSLSSCHTHLSLSPDRTWSA